MLAEAVAPVVETAEVVAETVAPAVDPGTLSWKKVAVVASIGAGVVIGAVVCKKLIDKRKAEKTVEINPVEVVEETPVMEEEAPAPAPKTKAKK